MESESYRLASSVQEEILSVWLSYLPRFVNLLSDTFREVNGLQRI